MPGVPYSPTGVPVLFTRVSGGGPPALTAPLINQPGHAILFNLTPPALNPCTAASGVVVATLTTPTITMNGLPLIMGGSPLVLTTPDGSTYAGLAPAGVGIFIA